jgi:hypothetical protein
MKSEIGIIVPSRGRPDNVAELLWQMETTVRDAGTVDIYVIVDDDDRAIKKYQDIAKAWDDKTKIQAHLIVQPSQRLGPILNEWAAKIHAEHRLIGFVGDDHRPRTEHWDTLLTLASDGKRHGVFYGGDGLQDQNLPTYVFITSHLYRELGYFVPKGIVHLFADNAWKTIGEKYKCLYYLPDLFFEHMHPVVGKSEWDETYIAANASDVWTADEKTFNDWRKEFWGVEG